MLDFSQYSQGVNKLLETLAGLGYNFVDKLFLQRLANNAEVDKKLKMDKADATGIVVKAKAQAESMEILAAAERSIALQNTDTHIDIIKKYAAVEKVSDTNINKLDYPSSSSNIISHAKERVFAEEMYKQGNIEDILLLAVDALADVHKVSEEPISKDWIMRYLDSVKFVSDKESQKIWADTLIREVTVTNSISIRSLNILRDCSPNDLRLLTKIAQMIIKYHDTVFILDVRPKIISHNQKFPEDMILSVKEFRHLTDMGILSSYSGGELFLLEEWKTQGKQKIFYSNKCIIFDNSFFGTSNVPYFPQHLAFSEAGKEIIILFKKSFRNEYLETLIGLLIQSYSVSLGDVITDGDGVTSIEIVREIPKNIITISIF